MNRLSEEQRNAVGAVIEMARKDQVYSALELRDGSDVYAHPSRKGIAWGVNKHGKRVARGVEK
jgi:hypothetical protein